MRTGQLVRWCRWMENFLSWVHVEFPEEDQIVRAARARGTRRARARAVVPRVVRGSGFRRFRASRSPIARVGARPTCSARSPRRGSSRLIRAGRGRARIDKGWRRRTRRAAARPLARRSRPRATVPPRRGRDRAPLGARRPAPRRRPTPRAAPPGIDPPRSAARESRDPRRARPRSARPPRRARPDSPPSSPPRPRPRLRRRAVPAPSAVPGASRAPRSRALLAR